MSKDNERKLLKALDKAATLSIGNSDPDDVLIKVATEYKLTPPELSRVVEAYNKAKSVAYLKKAAAEDRAGDFPLADMSRISSRIYGMEKTEAELVIPMRNYASEYIASESLDKVASVEVAIPTPRFRTAVRARESVWKEAMDHFDVQKNVKTILVNRVRETSNKRACELKKIAEHCEHFRPADLVKVARTLVNGYGDKHAGEVIDELNLNMKCNRLPKNIEKTAHAVIFPCSEPYISLSKIAGLTTKLDAAKKDLDWFEKVAEDEGPNILAKATSGINKILTDPDKPRKDNIDINTGMPTEWDNYLKELNAKRMLYNLYRFDPIIQSYPLSDVADTYNEVVTTTPGLADNKAWMRATLRRSLTQGKSIDPFEIKDMLMAQTQKTVGGKNYADTVSKMGTDERGGGYSKPRGRPIEDDPDLESQLGNA